jgi:hypothetical protein
MGIGKRTFGKRLGWGGDEEGVYTVVQSRAVRDVCVRLCLSLCVLLNEVQRGRQEEDEVDLHPSSEGMYLILRRGGGGGHESGV